MSHVRGPVDDHLRCPLAPFLRASVIDGGCPECAGERHATSVQACENHRPDLDEYQCCPNGSSLFWMLVAHVCEGCEYR